MIEQVNGTTFRCKVGEDYTEIGNKDASRFEPHICLPRWAGECKFKLLFPSVQIATPVMTEDKGRLQYRIGDIGLDWYSIAPNKQHDGALEQEITLFRRPPSNELRLPYEADGLALYHQPPLAQWEIDDGDFRPENIVNSIAVYHATRTSLHQNMGDAKKYLCGKAFHLFRGEAVDSSGWKVWIDKFLDLDRHEIVYMMPYDFWLNAAYPVYHALGDIFGWNGTGGTSTSAGNLIKAAIAACPATGTGDSISAYVINTTAAKNAKCAIFDTSGNILTNGTTGEISVPVASQFNTFTFSTSPSLAVATYWLAHFMDTDGGTQNLVYDTDSYNMKWGSETYPTWPDPWTPGGQYNGRRMSIYCTYTPSGAAGPAGVKTLEDLAIASVKTINDTAIASVKTINDSAA